MISSLQEQVTTKSNSIVCDELNYCS